MATQPNEATGLAKLREPFPAHQISKLPKPYKKDSPKGKCAECGGYHGLPAVHLDYVGHAALTDRLLDTDPQWSWEPAAYTPEGLPAFDRTGGLWIKLTVLGVTRLGYGDAGGKQGGDAVKEIIGDALRNAAMRFGAALDLWHKGDLHADDEEEKPAANDRNGNGLRRDLEESVRQTPARDLPFPQGPAKNKTDLKTQGRELWRQVLGCGDEDELAALLASHKDLQRQLAEALPDWWSGGTKNGEPFEGLATVIANKQTELAAAQESNWRGNPLAAG